MTVQELIDTLMKIEDKHRNIYIQTSPLDSHYHIKEIAEDQTWDGEEVLVIK